ncbi:hypothetical protein L1987_74598 [Smallanthus sonchifolius]|uniref:Uncharacterized protein n=1 Tax=Smallanthus sonchifolius TaxID=185202 RepID=A0ACB9A7J5_9ASTR|nr:hypothetical protein L1987_74598 [Smallanthus sonchifolius]
MGFTGRKIVSGSATGGLKETQEMLDFAAEHGVTADIELIPIDYLNTAMDRVLKSDVRYRFVIDVARCFALIHSITAPIIIASMFALPALDSTFPALFAQ